MILIRHGQTEFNRIFSATRQDPGIRDPQLTELGRRQAAAVAVALRALNLGLLISRPYTRALETAEIIADHLKLPIMVEALVAERCVFTCDVGSELATLRGRWPDIPSIIFPTLGGLSKRKPKRYFCSGPRRFAAASPQPPRPRSR